VGRRAGVKRSNVCGRCKGIQSDVDYIDKARKKTSIENKKVELAPVLITPENYKSAEVQKLLQTPDKF
jgi:hypothetical protein